MPWSWPAARRRDLWGEMDRLQRDLNRLFEPFTRAGGRLQGDFPAVNIWTGDDNALLTAEIPGVSPEDLEVTVKNDTVTIRGTRGLDDIKEGESYLRQERGAGSFVRSFSLPFHVDGDRVDAQYRMGILQLVLPRREEDKPRRIAVNAG
jgi:HSP20 family protein